MTAKHKRSWGLLVGALLLTLGGSVRAADAPNAPGSVQLTAVALPVIVDARLINYIFVTVKLDLAPGADGAAVRSKEPFFRDSLVRAGHRSPFTVPTDYTRLDVPRIRAQVLHDAAAIVGRGVVRDVEVVKQVSQHRSGLPSPAARVSHPELIP